jgi:hypothetical protein
MSVTRFTFCVLLAASVLAIGCASKTASDPLTGFYPDALYSPDSHQAITDDYKNYLQTLSPEERKYAGLILFYKDGTGQHAVQIRIGLNGTSWEHILIYDKDDKRIKATKYVSGRYAS